MLEIFNQTNSIFWQFAAYVCILNKCLWTLSIYCSQCFINAAHVLLEHKVC